MTRAIDLERWRLRDLIERSRRRLPALELIGLRTAQLGQRLGAAARRLLVDRDARLDALVRSLTHLDPRAVLERGYSLVRDADGRIVRRGADVAAGDTIDIAFSEGSATARVERSS
jgi:exodeoxyribonuclease VII large subunit